MSDTPNLLWPKCFKKYVFQKWFEKYLKLCTYNLYWKLRDRLGSFDLLNKEVIDEKIREIKLEDKKKSLSGICISIKYCLDNLKEIISDLK